MNTLYQPPYTLTPTILRLVGEISEWIGRYSVTADASLTPRLRRGNRLRSIQSSLAIENNTLTLEQVTAVLDGKRVLGLPREILMTAIQETATTNQVSDHVTDQVKRLLHAVGNRDATGAELMKQLQLSHRATFRKNYLEPALATGLIERTQPQSPRSPTQKYRLTLRGRALLKKKL